jgi:triacylglycerol lipase
VILADSILLLAALLTPPASPPPTECVVLLHGLGRSEFSMARIERELEKDGYIVVNETYPSIIKSIEELTVIVESGIANCRKSTPTAIHFVTHSMGGILVRTYFQTHSVPEAKRLVMLGPPNHGSEVVDEHQDAWWFKLATGPAGQQLTTSGSQSLVASLKPIPLEIGIIAGTKSIDPLLDVALPKPNDGKVSVQSAMLPEMSDFITMDEDHTFMMYSMPVIRQVRLFLRTGKFDHLYTN